MPQANLTAVHFGSLRDIAYAARHLHVSASGKRLCHEAADMLRLIILEPREHLIAMWFLREIEVYFSPNDADRINKSSDEVMREGGWKIHAAMTAVNTASSDEVLEKAREMCKALVAACESLIENKATIARAHWSLGLQERPTRLIPANAFEAVSVPPRGRRAVLRLVDGNTEIPRK